MNRRAGPDQFVYPKLVGADAVGFVTALAEAARSLAAHPVLEPAPGRYVLEP